MRGQATNYNPAGVAITGGTGLWNDGLVGSPSIAFASQPTTGFYLQAAGSPRLSVAGADTVRWDGSGNMVLKSSFFLSDTSGVSVIDCAIARQSGRLAYNAGTATPAGGSTGMGIVMGSTSGFGIYIGSGVPTVSAAQGSLYLRSDGSSTSTRAYINSSSGSGTTWTAITTAT
jgi:hypothetical protein